MGCPWRSMSQQGRKPNKDSTLVFLWIQVVLLFVISGEVSAVSYTGRIGSTIRIKPCMTVGHDNIKTAMYGYGAIPKDESIIIERDRNDTVHINNANRHFDVDEEFRLVIQNPFLNDSGDYWCQVTRVGRSAENCNFNLTVRSKPKNEKTSPRVPPVAWIPILPESSSTAAPIFASSTFTMILCLVSGFLTIWRGFLPIWLTNVDGVR